MLFNKTIRIKNGHECTLRSPRGKDAEEILDHMRLTSGETDFMLRYPDEIATPAEDEAALLEKIAKSENEVMISAEIDGRIVANAGISPASAACKCCHRAVFGISVQRAFWGLGIGSAILSAIIDCAREAGYLQLELDVVSTNAPAIALYKKFGFTEFGENKNALLLRDGSFKSLIYMSLTL